MDANKNEHLDQTQGPQLMAILEELGVTEVSPETLRTAMLGGVLLDEAKTVIDEKQKPC